MNWYKIAKNFLRNPSNLKDVTNSIFAAIKKIDLNSIEDKHFVTQIMIDNPYLNMPMPVAVFLVNDIGGGERSLGGSITDLYDTIQEEKKIGREFLGFESVDGVEDNKIEDSKEYSPYEIIFSGDAEVEGQCEMLTSHIDINLKANRSDDDLKNTIYHELTHILDPATSPSSMRKNYKRPDEDGIEAYLNNPTEFNVRMVEVKNYILSSIEQIESLDDKIEELEWHLANARYGNIEMILESVRMDREAYNTFVIYYLQNPKTKRIIIEQISRLLINLSNKYKTIRETKVNELV